MSRKNGASILHVCRVLPSIAAASAAAMVQSGFGIGCVGDRFNGVPLDSDDSKETYTRNMRRCSVVRCR